MLISILQQLLVSAAALLSVSESLTVFYGTDGPLASPCAEAEDAEEDQRDDLVVQVSVPIVGTTLHVSTDSYNATLSHAPVVCGPHNERNEQ